MDISTFTPEETTANGSKSLKDRLLAAASTRPRKVVELQLRTAPDSEETETFRLEIRAILAGDRARFFRQMRANEDEALERMSFDLIVDSCFDPDTGEKLFTDEDRPALRAWLAGTVEELVGYILTVSGLDQEAGERAGKGSP